ncbi:hypothetical protein STEG23_038437 [Scotinomys teguina]
MGAPLRGPSERPAAPCEGSGAVRRAKGVLSLPPTSPEGQKDRAAAPVTHRLAGRCLRSHSPAARYPGGRATASRRHRPQRWPPPPTGSRCLRQRRRLRLRWQPARMRSRRRRHRRAPPVPPGPPLSSPGRRAAAGVEGRVHADLPLTAGKGPVDDAALHRLRDALEALLHALERPLLRHPARCDVQQGLGALGLARRQQPSAAPPRTPPPRTAARGPGRQAEL